MNPWMRIGTILVACTLLAGCGGSSDDSSGTGTLEGPVWNLVGWSEPGLNPSDFTITAEFAGGEIFGRSAVNRYNGPYTTTEAGGFSTGTIQMTLIAGSPEAMQAESRYIQLIQQAASYRINGGQLVFYSGGGQVLLIFQ